MLQFFDFSTGDYPNVQEKYDIFCALPVKIQHEAIRWGTNDTVVRELIADFLLTNQLGISLTDYYNSDVAKNYFDNDVIVPFNWDKLHGIQ